MVERRESIQERLDPSGLSLDMDLSHTARAEVLDHLLWRELPDSAGRSLAGVVEPDVHAAPSASQARFRIASTASWAPTRLR